MEQQLHGGLVEEDHSFRVEARRGGRRQKAELGYKAPRHPSATFAVPHPVKALQFCFGHPGLCGGTHGNQNVAAVEDGRALFLIKSSSRGSAALGSKKVVSGSGFSGSGLLVFLFTLRYMGWRGD